MFKEFSHQILDFVVDLTIPIDEQKFNNNNNIFNCKFDRCIEYYKIPIQSNKSVLDVCVNHTLDKVFPVIIICNGYFIVCLGPKVVCSDLEWWEETV